MKFSLIKNNLHKSKDDQDYVACTRVYRRLSVEHLIKRLSYSSTFTDADIHGVLKGMEKELVEIISLGYSIDLGFFSLGFNVKGRFNSADEGFRKDRHWINVTARVKKSFIQAVNNAAKPQKIHCRIANPCPLLFQKISGNKIISEFQPGNLVRIFGKNLAFDVDDTDIGVFLHTENEKYIRINEYAKSGINTILLKIPDQIQPGIYNVEIRVRTRYGKIIKGSLQDSITISY